MYLEKLFVCRKFHKNGQIKCIGGKWTCQVAMGPLGGVGRCHMESPDGPTRLPLTDPRESLHTASPALIHVSLMHRWRLSYLGSMGPLSFTWGGGQNRPPNWLPDRSNRPTCHATTFGSHQALLDGKAVGWTIGRRPLCRPMPPTSPPPYLCLQVPPALYTL